MKKSNKKNSLKGSPKLFISYSWGDPEHEQWVIELATDLRNSGVDVILDKWDLKEGNDAIVFMEKMVTDQEIKKVVLICNRNYSEKADARSGGVGTEAQIISKEIYEKIQQDKFVAIVTEKDNDGKPYVPTYYKSRIHIDLSEPDAYSDNYEKLLRWIYNKPLYIKPDLGEIPAFLLNEDSISLGTTASFKRVIDSIKANKSFAFGALDEYLTLFSNNLEKFRISLEKNDSKESTEPDELIIKNIEEFIPYRNEIIQLLITLTQYGSNDEYVQRLHRFFENIIPYMDRPAHITHSTSWDYDNYKFIIHELFLFVLSILIKFEKFNQAAHFLNQQYYVPNNYNYGQDVMVTFNIFRKYLYSFASRNKRLELGRLSLRADLLKKRCHGTSIDFTYLMQTDFILFLRAEFNKLRGNASSEWWPETLLYVGHFPGPFEIFARARSKEYFDKIKCLLNIDNPKDISELISEYTEGKRRLPRWEFESFDPVSLIGFDKLTTKP